MARRKVRDLMAVAVGSSILAAMAQPASALDISKHPRDSAEINAILLKGSIVEGDSYEFRTYVGKLPKKASIVVYLDSPGGNLREGLRLGQFFYERKIETVVDAKASCTSACALAFLGGRDANGNQMRTKVSTGAVGFHSFTRNFDDDKSYSSKDLKFVLQRTQTEVAGIAEYLRSIDTNQDVLRIMLGAPSSAMNFISNDDAIELGIRVWDAKLDKAVDPAPVLERLAKARAEAKTLASHPPATKSGPVPASASSGGAAGADDAVPTPAPATAPPSAPTPVAAPLKPATLPPGPGMKKPTTSKADSAAGQ